MTAEIKPNQLAALILGISSDCVHFITPSGAVGTDTHIFFRQIEALSVYFKSVIICCPFAAFDPALSYSIYQNKQISFIQSPHVGGDRILDKIELLSAIPKWLKLFHKLDEQTDIVYQRFPNNLNIPGFFYFYFKRKKVFASFTGSWDEDPGASWSTRFQRYLLIHFFGDQFGCILRRGKCVHIFTAVLALPIHKKNGSQRLSMCQKEYKHCKVRGIWRSRYT